MSSKNTLLLTDNDDIEIFSDSNEPRENEQGEWIGDDIYICVDDEEDVKYTDLDKVGGFYIEFKEHYNLPKIKVYPLSFDVGKTKESGALIVIKGGTTTANDIEQLFK